MIEIKEGKFSINLNLLLFVVSFANALILTAKGASDSPVLFIPLATFTILTLYNFIAMFARILD